MYGREEEKSTHRREQREESEREKKKNKRKAKKRTSQTNNEKKKQIHVPVEHNNAQKKKKQKYLPCDCIFIFSTKHKNEWKKESWMNYEWENSHEYITATERKRKKMARLLCQWCILTVSYLIQWKSQENDGQNYKIELKRKGKKTMSEWMNEWMYNKWCFYSIESVKVWWMAKLNCNLAK